MWLSSLAAPSTEESLNGSETGPDSQGQATAIDEAIEVIGTLCNVPDIFVVTCQETSASVHAIKPVANSANITLVRASDVVEPLVLLYGFVLVNDQIRLPAAGATGTYYSLPGSHVSPTSSYSTRKSLWSWRSVECSPLPLMGSICN